MAVSNGASTPIVLTLTAGGTAYQQWPASPCRADSLAPNNVTISNGIQCIWDCDYGVANSSNSSPAIPAYILGFGQSFSIPGITNTNQVWSRVYGVTNSAIAIPAIYVRGLA